MPELPEVETIRKQLQRGGETWPSLIGMRIIAAQVTWPRTLATPGIDEFVSRIVDQSVKEIQRRGKYVALALSKDHLVFHLRMSGDLVVEPEYAPISKHHRLILFFANKWRLAFIDPRKFGRVWFMSELTELFNSLGPEPLDDDFTPRLLYQRLHTFRRQLKPLLLDQSFLAGLGNIYTDEALHQARLHPCMISDQVTEDQSESLWRSIRQVLSEGIRRNGASIDWVYRGGDFQNYFRVYQRTGKPCDQCGTTIVRVVVGQRGTHICPNCQIDPRNTSLPR